MHRSGARYYDTRCYGFKISHSIVRWNAGVRYESPLAPFERTWGQWQACAEQTPAESSLQPRRARVLTPRSIDIDRPICRSIGFYWRFPCSHVCSPSQAPRVYLVSLIYCDGLPFSFSGRLILSCWRVRGINFYANILFPLPSLRLPTLHRMVNDSLDLNRYCSLLLVYLFIR